MSLGVVSSSRAILPHMDITQNQYIVNGLQNWLADYWIELLTILIGALLAYFVGTRLVTIAIRRIVKGGKHREWHKKDIEKRQKTLVDLFINIWRMLIFFTVLYALAKLFVPNISETLAQ